MLGIDLDALDAKLLAGRDGAVAMLREIASGLEQLSADQIPEALTPLAPVLADLSCSAVTARLYPDPAQS